MGRITLATTAMVPYCREPVAIGTLLSFRPTKTSIPPAKAPFRRPGLSPGLPSVKFARSVRLGSAVVRPA